MSGVIHATACAQSGAVAVALPIAKVSLFLFSAFFPFFLAYSGPHPERSRRISAPTFVYRIQMRDWRRRMDLEDNDVGGRSEDAETIAAYFDMHGLSSTGLIVDRMDHVRTFQTKTSFFTSFCLSFSSFYFSLLEVGLEHAQPRAVWARMKIDRDGIRLTVDVRLTRVRLIFLFSFFGLSFVLYWFSHALSSVGHWHWHRWTTRVCSPRWPR